MIRVGDPWFYFKLGRTWMPYTDRVKRVGYEGFWCQSGLFVPWWRAESMRSPVRASDG